MLKLASLNVHLDFSTSVEFPYWMGSTFRGGFGIYLKRACCPDLSRNCHECNERKECIFYHTHMREEPMRGHASPPKPLVIIPPFFGKKLFVEKGGHLDLDILLYGGFIRYLPHAVLGLRLLGQKGIGSKRRYDMNRFVISGMTCNFTGKIVYDGNKINLENIGIIDFEDVEPLEVNNRLKVRFRTPFISKTGEFPPSLDRLLWHIRQRLIHYVNEYGDGSQVLDFNSDGKIVRSKKHFHRLKRRSVRGGKQEFHAYSGVVEYEIEQIDHTSKWLLEVGKIVGAGAKPSFGCGYLSFSTKKS